MRTNAGFPLLLLCDRYGEGGGGSGWREKEGHGRGGWGVDIREQVWPSGKALGW